MVAGRRPLEEWKEKFEKGEPARLPIEQEKLIVNKVNQLLKIFKDPEDHNKIGSIIKWGYEARPGGKEMIPYFSQKGLAILEEYERKLLQEPEKALRYKDLVEGKMEMEEEEESKEKEFELEALTEIEDKTEEKEEEQKEDEESEGQLGLF